MNSIATVDVAGVSAETPPLFAAGADLAGVVLIDGIPEPRLVVREHRVQGPLDRRQATLAVAAADSRPAQSALMARWLNTQQATLAVPIRLVDDQVRWSVLVNGRLETTDTQDSARSQQRLLTLVDQWDTELDKTIGSVWWQTEEGLLFDDSRPAVMRVGDRANRSDQVWSIGDQRVYVFQDQGQAWTTGTALAAVNALAGLRLSLRLLPVATRDAALQRAVDLSAPLDRVLTQLLQPHGLVIERDLAWEGGVVTQRRAVRPVVNGRRARLSWAGDGRRLGEVRRVRSQHPTPAAQQWAAQADGWVVESTFELVHGWDTSLVGQPDAVYSKADHEDFATFANVYRLWVLNEDGRFTGAPFHQGAAFDLTAFFNDGLEPAARHGTIRPRPLRFEDGLTLDATGTRRGVTVEISTDGGSNWSTYPGVVVVRDDRAGVYLDDATLPLAFLAAAKSGDAMVRVTASLRSPIPVRVRRWAGNPFAGSEPPRRFDLGGAFRFQRVGAQSIHFDEVNSGQTQAVQADETGAMTHWLIQRMERESRSQHVTTGTPGRAELLLAGAWPMLRVGDRLMSTAGQGQDAAGGAEAIDTAAVVVTELRCQWSDSIAPGDQRSTTAPDSGPRTRVVLAF